MQSPGYRLPRIHILEHLAVRLDRSHHVRMRAYSLDLRHKVVEAVLRGMPKAEAARSFGIGISTVKRYVGKAQKGEDLAPRRAPGKRRTLDEEAMRLLGSDLKILRPALTLSLRRTREVSETYIEQMLGPALRPGQIVVMDNLSSHKSERVHQLIEERRLRAALPAALLAGSQPYRRGVRQGQGVVARG